MTTFSILETSSRLPPKLKEKLVFGVAENDSFNKLILGAQLDWRQVSVLRGYCKYLLQVGVPFSQSYMEDTLNRYPAIAGLLIELFEAGFITYSNGQKTKILGVSEDVLDTFDMRTTSGADADWRIATADLMPRHFTITIYDVNASLRATSKDNVVVVNDKLAQTMFGDSDPLDKVITVNAPQATAWRVFTAGMSSWWPLAHYKIGRVNAVAAVVEKLAARCGNRLINPRSSSPLTRRWMPDLDLRFKASFISSKDGETPVAVSRWLINSNNSRCFLVSMGPPSAAQNEP